MNKKAPQQSEIYFFDTVVFCYFKFVYFGDLSVRVFSFVACPTIIVRGVDSEHLLHDNAGLSWLVS